MRVNSICAAVARPVAFVSRCLAIRGGKLVWTQCAMGWIESCTTGTDQVNIGAPRRAVGTAEEPINQPVSSREMVDAGVALALAQLLKQRRMRMLMLAQGRARFLAEDAGCWLIFIQGRY